MRQSICKVKHLEDHLAPTVDGLALHVDELLFVGCVVLCCDVLIVHDYAATVFDFTTLALSRLKSRPPALPRMYQNPRSNLKASPFRHEWRVSSTVHVRVQVQTHKPHPPNTCGLTWKHCYP